MRWQPIIVLFSEAEKKLKYSTRPGGSEIYKNGRRNLRRMFAWPRYQITTLQLLVTRMPVARISKATREPVKHSLHELVAKVESHMKGNTSKRR
ncbi:hypothetical protein V1505DRAFT_53267 [Lipomyces doorenjongii]